MEMESCVPPGFRFHPTEEELVGYYLKRKINSLNFDLDVIADIDLYKIEPWDIQANCKLGYEEQKEWYFFSHKDKKYPTGTRTNRATAAGFWKATGRDKAVLSKNRLIGMRKTLVFYRGRAPNGSKTDWIMHEYSLHTSQHELLQEEGWVVCRAFKKPSPNQAQGFDSAWRLSHFLKDHTHFAGSPPFSDTMITAHVLNEPPQCSNFNQPVEEDRRESLCRKDTILENHTVDLPNFDSPTNSALNDEDVWSRNSYFDWKDVDNLLATKPVEMDSLSHSKLVAISRNHDPRSHNQRMIFRSFPNL